MNIVIYLSTNYEKEKHFVDKRLHENIKMIKASTL